MIFFRKFARNFNKIEHNLAEHEFRIDYLEKDLSSLEQFVYEKNKKHAKTEKKAKAKK